METPGQESRRTFREQVRKASEEELHEWAAFTSHFDLCSCAKAVLARRERRRSFFIRDIVAWIALILSVISIYLTISQHQ